MKTTFILSLVALLFVGCSNMTNTKPQRIYFPGQDLSIENPNFKHNMIKEGGFFSSPEYDGWIFSGDVRNNGSVIYKDIVIEIQYKNGQGGELTKEKFTLYKTVAPGTTADINQKLYPPNEMREYLYGVTTAAVVHTSEN